LYQELIDDSIGRGYQQFRCNRLGWDSIYKESAGIHGLNQKIKEALDPHHIISPGKYGIV
jgi:hypothetical protein